METKLAEQRVEIARLKRLVTEKNTLVGALQAILKGGPDDEPPTDEVIVAALRHLGKLLSKSPGEWRANKPVTKALIALCMHMADFIRDPEWIVAAARLSERPLYKGESWIRGLAAKAVLDIPRVPKLDDPRVDLIDTANAFFDSIGTRDVDSNGRTLLAVALKVVYDGTRRANLTVSAGSFACPEMSTREPSDLAQQPPSAPRCPEDDKGNGA